MDPRPCLGRRLLGAVLHPSNQPGELSRWPRHDDSTINIVLELIIIIINVRWLENVRKPEAVSIVFPRKTPTLIWTISVNPLESRGNYSATSNNMKLVHWPLMGGLLHLVQRGGDWAGPQPTQAPLLCTKCNSPPINGQCTNHCIAI